uniref:Uncharacterized protein n=1 Tax=Ananas comosus var. bracteatus TaxID=296719 RepID=A0A6V7QS91_ANACO
MRDPPCGGLAATLLSLSERCRSIRDLKLLHSVLIRHLHLLPSPYAHRILAKLLRFSAVSPPETSATLPSSSPSTSPSSPPPTLQPHLLLQHPNPRLLQLQLPLPLPLPLRLHAPTRRSLQSLVANFASPRAAPLFDAARLWTHKETHTIIYANALSAVPSSLTNPISSVLFFPLVPHPHIPFPCVSPSTLVLAPFTKSMKLLPR